MPRISDGHGPKIRRIYSEPRLNHYEIWVAFPFGNGWPYQQAFLISIRIIGIIDPNYALSEHSTVQITQTLRRSRSYFAEQLGSDSNPWNPLESQESLGSL